MSDDDALRRLFSSAHSDVSDDGFVSDVMQRVHRVRTRRRIVLSSAAMLGGVIAVPAIWQAVQTLAAAPWAHLVGPPALNVVALCVGAAAMWVYSISVEA